MNRDAACATSYKTMSWSGAPDQDLAGVVNLLGLPHVRLAHPGHDTLLSIVSVTAKEKGMLRRLMSWGDAALQLFETQGCPRDAIDHSRLPSGYLFDVGALMQLATWEVAGLLYYREFDIPRFTEAMRSLKLRIIALNAGDSTTIFGTLSDQVLAFCAKHLADHDHHAIDADVVAVAEADAGVVALSDFLWQFRHLGATT